MNAIVPDTFQGAVILSVIDFFLSFLIISGIGFVLSLFPLLNKAADLFGGHKTHAPKAAKPAERKAESPKPATARPPITSPISAPASRASMISRAMRPMTAGSMP